jgi:hypothetical protein
MGNTNHMDESPQTYGGQQFQPFEFDESVDPDLFDGLYEVTISDVKFRMSNPDKLTGVSYPQLVVEWRAESTYEDSDECKRSVGNSVSEFLTFRPKGDRQGNMSKQRLTMIRNHFSIDTDVVPKRIRSQADFDELRNALKGQTATMRASSKTDKTGALRTNLAFEGGGGGAVEEQEEERPTAPTLPQRTTAVKPTNGAAKKVAPKGASKRR